MSCISWTFLKLISNVTLQRDFCDVTLQYLGIMQSLKFSDGAPKVWIETMADDNHITV